MYIVKSCNKEHNLKTTHSIRIGTLFGFRELESLELRDELEGTFDFRIDIEKSEIPIEIFLYLYNGLFSSGTPNYPYNCFSIPQNKNIAIGVMHGGSFQFINGYAIVENSSIEMRSHYHNCFVFCTSLINSLPTKPKFDGYDDFWFFKFEDADKFLKKTQEGIKKEIIEKKLIITDGEFNHNLLTIKPSFNKIEYKPRYIFSNNINYKSLSSVIKSLENIAYTKPLFFKNDEEFRFIFEIYYAGKPAIIINNPIDIELDNDFVGDLLL